MPAPPNRFPIRLLTADGPQEAAAFAAFDPAVDPSVDGPGLMLTGAGRFALSEIPPWAIVPADPHAPPLAFTPLDAALRAANYDGAGLLPGALDAFSQGGRVYGLPIQAVPAAVRYRPDAFTAAGLPPPTAEWTLDQFEQVCATLQAAIRSGRVAGYRSPLPRAAAGAPFDPTRPLQIRVGDLFSSLIWGGFVLGHGASAAQGGHFTLTDAAVGRALARVVSLARAYGPPPGTSALASPAMEFVGYYGDTTAAAAGWRLARFPRGPVRPTVPVAFGGVGLAWEDAAGMVFPNKNLRPPDAALDAVVRYALWRGQATSTSDPPPVLADAAVQARYWAAPDSAAVGAWRSFADAQPGWPPTSGANPEAVVCNALAAAADGDRALEDLLREAEATLNAAAARYAQASAGPSDPVEP